MSEKKKPIITLKVPVPEPVIKVTETDESTKSKPKRKKIIKHNINYDYKEHNKYYVHYKIRDTLEMIQYHQLSPNSKFLDYIDGTIVSYTDNSITLDRSRSLYHIHAGTAKDVKDEYVKKFGDRLLEFSIITDSDDSPPRTNFW